MYVQYTKNESSPKAFWGPRGKRDVYHFVIFFFFMNGQMPNIPIQCIASLLEDAGIFFR